MQVVADQLIDLFQQTAEDHHVTYQATDGEDPEWPLWYAEHLIELGIEELLSAKLLKSELVYLLVRADRERGVKAPGSDWKRFYAAFLARRYLS
jgi:hypothetical protein